MIQEEYTFVVVEDNVDRPARYMSTDYKLDQLLKSVTSMRQQLTASCSEISQVCHQMCTATHAESVAVDQHSAPAADSSGSRAGLVPQSAIYLDMYRPLSSRRRNDVDAWLRSL
eukprot:3529138-Pyramimonas_sp.AAC.1